MILLAQAYVELTALVPLDPNLLFLIQPGPVPPSAERTPPGLRRSQGCAMHVGVIPLHGPVGDDRLYPLR